MDRRTFIGATVVAVVAAPFTKLFAKEEQGWTKFSEKMPIHPSSIKVRTRVEDVLAEWGPDTQTVEDNGNGFCLRMAWWKGPNEEREKGHRKDRGNGMNHECYYRTQTVIEEDWEWKYIDLGKGKINE